MMQKMLNPFVKKGIIIGFTLHLAVALAFAVPVVSTAQETIPPQGPKIHRSIPPKGAKTHTVVPGERFRAGWLKRWLIGNDYRYVWTTPIEIPVLDLDSAGVHHHLRDSVDYLVPAEIARCDLQDEILQIR